MQRREPVGGAAREELGVGGDRTAQVVRPAERGEVERVQRRLGGEQRLQHGRLAVVEREPHGRDPVLERAGQLGLAREDPLHGRGVALLDGGEEAVGGGHGAEATR